MTISTIILAFGLLSNGITSIPESAQNSLDQGASVFDDIWKILLRVKYTYNEDAYIPQFNADIKALDRKIVTVRGYLYPLEEKSKHEFFMLSYYPINICFFCGGAGPESVIEVSMKKPLRYTSKPIKIKGKLRLNYQDKDRLFYILLGAELVN